MMHSTLSIATADHVMHPPTPHNTARHQPAHPEGSAKSTKLQDSMLTVDLQASELIHSNSVPACGVKTLYPMKQPRDSVSQEPNFEWDAISKVIEETPEDEDDWNLSDIDSQTELTSSNSLSSSHSSHTSSDGQPLDPYFKKDQTAQLDKEFEQLSAEEIDQAKDAADLMVVNHEDATYEDMAQDLLDRPLLSQRLFQTTLRGLLTSTDQAYRIGGKAVNVLDAQLFQPVLDGSAKTTQQLRATLASPRGQELQQSALSGIRTFGFITLGSLYYAGVQINEAVSGVAQRAPSTPQLAQANLASQGEQEENGVELQDLSEIRRSRSVDKTA